VPSGAVVLAVDLEVDSLTIATVGLGGRVFEKVRVGHTPGEGTTPTDVVARLAELAPPMVASLPDGHNLVGMAVAVAGVVRRQDGFVHVAPNLGWTNVPLAGMISAELGIERVMMANEADLAALAEHRRATDGSLRHLIFVAGEVGIGIGIIYNGSPMLGTAGYAGEAGHAMVNPEGRPCRCGAIGCWETEVGEESLARLAGISPEVAHDGLVAEILRRAHAGDQQVFAALAEIGRWLGIGIGNLINVFNPDLVVIGGFFHPLYPFLEQAVNDAARSVALTAPWMSCSIRASAIGVDAALVGAAELALAAVIGDPTIVGESVGPLESFGLVGRKVEGVGH
jgi:predicted NBD/HSP70 family sugar kinase